MFTFLADVLQRHPNAEEKLKGGLRAFRVKPNPLGSGIGTDLQTEAGEWVSFSWVSCAKGKPTTTPRQDLFCAMRSAVRDQTDPIRGGRVCAHCQVDTGHFDVDHVTPFADLAAEFLRNWVKPLPTLFNQSALRTSEFKPEDADIQSAWSGHHATQAKLQLLCVPCHKVKTSGKPQVYAPSNPATPSEAPNPSV